MKKTLQSIFALALLVWTAGTASAQCTNSSSFGSATVNTLGTTTTISSCSYAGEYSTISGVVSGQQLRFTSSAGDFITIHTGSPAGPVVAFGVSPLTYTSAFTGTVYAHWNLVSPACGTQSTCRTTTVQCLSCTPAPAPANDNCTGALNASCGSVVTGNTTTATNDAGFPACTGTGNNFNGVWYKVTPASTGTMTVSTCGGASWDTYLRVFSGSCGALSCMANNDDFCSLQSQVTVAVIGGQTYYILLSGFGSASFGSYSMTINCAVTASCFDGSIAAPGSVTGNTCGAGDQSSLRTGEDLIYKVTIPTSGCYTFSMCGSSPNWDSYMYLTTLCPGLGGTPGGGTILASDDDGCGGVGVSRISNVSLAAGTYYVTIEPFSSGGCGSFNLNVSGGTPPSAGPISGPGSFCCNSTNSFSVPFVSGVTYTWSTTNGTIVSGQGSSSVSIAWGSGSGVVSVTPSNACGSGPASSATFSCNANPSNDNCANATAVSGSSFFASNLCATGTDISSCTFNDTKDVWYSWTAPSCGRVNINTCSNDRTFDTHLSLWSACGGAELACNDDAGFLCGPNFLGSDITANVQAGVTYLIRFAGYNASEGTSTVNISMTAPLSGGATATSSYACGYNISCNGGNNGSAGASVAGGIAPYSYSWSNGATTANISGLSAGTYSVTITDAIGCSVSGSVTLTQPAAVTVNILDAHSPPFSCGYNISCNGASDGAVLADAAGGCGPYTYSWSTGSTNGIITNLPAGPVSVTVTDANGCSASATYTLTQPEPVAVSGTLSVYNCGYNVSCNGGSNGSVDQSVSGGCAPYSYSWSNGANTEDLSGVGAGTYSVTIVDANGCTSTASYTLTEPTAVTVTCPANTTVFPGYGPASSATLTATGIGGGCGPYSILWSTGATTASITVSPAVTTDYTVTVTDANGCTASCTVRVCAINVSWGNNQVTICHIPPGNPGAANTLHVGSGSVASHLAHGDYLGACGVGNQPCTTGGNKGSEGAAIESADAVFEAYPNPLDVSTTLAFSFGRNENVTLKVYTLTGAEVATLFQGEVAAGVTQKVEFSRGNLAEGVYMARLSTLTGESRTIRLVVAK